MAPVFGRSEPNPHPYEPLLEELLTHSEAEERAVASNVCHDARVSEEREKVFDESFEKKETGQDLLNALENYKEKRVRSQLSPDFIDAQLNGGNILTGTPSGEFHISKQAWLARVVVLNRLTFLPHGGMARPGPLRVFTLSAGADQEYVDKCLDDQMRSPGADALVPAILEEMNPRSDKPPHHPTWVTLWKALDWENEPPHRWLEAVGIHDRKPGRWVVVLKYRVEEVDKLVRPTVLDAGKYPQHFPSPVAIRRPKCGHPMDLKIPPPIPGSALRNEYIHKQIHHPESHWREGGSLCARTEQGTSAELIKQRVAHLHRLEFEHGVLGWNPGD